MLFRLGEMIFGYSADRYPPTAAARITNEMRKLPPYTINLPPSDCRILYRLCSYREAFRTNSFPKVCGKPCHP